MESFAVGTACRFREKERADGSHTHSSREPEGSVHFIIPQVWCRGLVRLLWGLSAKEKWSGIPVPTRQPLRFSMQIRASNLGLHYWLPISCDPRWRHGVKIATCVGWEWGVLEERTVTLYLGCSSSKGQDCSSQEAWSQLTGLLASASLLMRDSEIFFCSCFWII